MPQGKWWRAGILLLACLCTFIVSAVVVITAGASDAVTGGDQIGVLPGIRNQTAPAGGAQYTGTVVTPGQPLVVRIGNGERQFGASADATITRNGHTVRLSDLHKGDTVTLFTNPDGSVQRADATSVDNGTSAWLWVIPLLLVLAALAVILLLWKRRRDSFVLEPNSDARPRRRGLHI